MKSQSVVINSPWTSTKFHKILSRLEALCSIIHLNVFNSSWIISVGYIHIVLLCIVHFIGIFSAMVNFEQNNIIFYGHPILCFFNMHFVNIWPPYGISTFIYGHMFYYYYGILMILVWNIRENANVCMFFLLSKCRQQYR